MNKILITGGTGFLGVHLARRLIKDKQSVTLFDIADLDARDLLGKVKVIKGDIRKFSSIDKAVKLHDYVVHAAAALPIQRAKKTIYSVNIDGTRNVLEACLHRKVKRVIFISSTAVYGVPKNLPEKEDSPSDPIGYYGESKVAGEQLCLEYFKKGLSLNIFRPKTFLGTERLGVFELWFDAIYNGRRVYILGNGNNKYQLLAVTDLVDAIIKALFTKVDGEIFNLGAGKFGNWRQDLGQLISYNKSKSKIISFPSFPSQLILAILEKLRLSPISAWHYKTMPVDSYASIDKAEKLLKWRPKKSNSELLLESYLWYKKNRGEVKNRIGNTHRVGWNFKILNLISKF